MPSCWSAVQRHRRAVEMPNDEYRLSNWLNFVIQLSHFGLSPVAFAQNALAIRGAGKGEVNPVKDTAKLVAALRKAGEILAA